MKLLNLAKKSLQNWSINVFAAKEINKYQNQQSKSCVKFQLTTDAYKALN